MKRILSLLIILCTALCAVPSFCDSDVLTGEAGANITWSFSSSTGIFTVTGEGAMYDYAKSNAAPHYWAINKGSVKKIVIGEGITRVGNYFFSGYQDVGSLSLPSTLTEIGEESFISLTSLKSLALPEKLTRIEKRAFVGCGVSSVVLPDSLTFIGEEAFGSCSGLKSINIPKNVDTIGAGAFMSNGSLTKLEVSPENKYFTSDGAGLYKGNELVCFYGQSTEYNMPENITRIYVKAFYGMDKIERVTVAEGITEIPDECFYQCDNLKSIKLPSTLEKIGVAAFGGCIELNNVDIPASVKRLEYQAFSGCDNLYNLTLHEGLAYADDAFFKLPAEKFVMPDSLVEGSVLSNFPNLKTIVFSKNMTKIEDVMLDYCTALESIEIPRQITYIGAAFCYCSSLKYAVIPETVEYIDTSAFRYCDAFTDVYYYGTKAQWETLLAPDEYREVNKTLKNANLHFLRTRLQDDKIIFTPNDLPNGCTVIFAFKNGDKIEKVQRLVNNGETVYLDKPQNCDGGKVFFLKDDKNIMPVCEAEQMRF